MMNFFFIGWQDKEYHESLMQHANISRCNFMKALHRSAPLEVAHGPAPFRYRSTRLMVRQLLNSSLTRNSSLFGCHWRTAPGAANTDGVHTSAVPIAALNVPI